MSDQPSRIGRHLNQRVARITSRLDDHKLLLGLLVAAAGAFLAYVAFVSTTGPPFQSRYEVTVAVPGDAPVLRTGQAVRIGGKLAGLISDVEPDRENGGTTVTANITKTEFRPLGRDARANVRVHSIVYQTYLELYPGDTSDPMPNGGTIPQARVTSGVDLLEVVQLFDEQARRSLRDTVVNIGYGFAGRGEELNDANGDLRPTAENLEAQFGALTRDEGALSEAIAGAAAVSDGLTGEQPDDISATLTSGSAAFGTLAERTEELREAINLLRPFEDELLATAPLADPLLRDLAAAATQLRPAAAGLNAALPEVNRLLALGDTLRTESARISAVTNPVLESTRPLLVEVFPTLAALDPLIHDVDRIVEAVTPYRKDIKRSGQGLAESTSIPFPQGRGAGAGAPMGRVITVLTCHANRNPFPGPGEGIKDSKSC